MLSNSYQDIHLFRFDEQFGDVFILAGENLQKNAGSAKLPSRVPKANAIRRGRSSIFKVGDVAQHG